MRIMTKKQWAKILHKFRNDHCRQGFWGWARFLPPHLSHWHKWGAFRNEKFVIFCIRCDDVGMRTLCGCPFARIDIDAEPIKIMPIDEDHFKYEGESFHPVGKGYLSSEYAMLINTFARLDCLIDDDDRLDTIMPIAKVLWDTLTILHVLRNYRKTDEEVLKECDLCINYLYYFDDFKGFLGVVETSSALLPYKENILKPVTDKYNLEDFIERYERLRNLKKEIQNTSEALLVELHRDLVTERKAFTAKEFEKDLNSKFRKPFYRDTMWEWAKMYGLKNTYSYGSSQHEFLDAVKERFKQKYKDSADKEFRKFRFTDRYENKGIAKILKNMPRI